VRNDAFGRDLNECDAIAIIYELIPGTTRGTQFRHRPRCLPKFILHDKYRS
jgi:hypothetical protein